MRKAGRGGRKPRLSTDELKKIERGLKRGPQALGYEAGLWTAWRVAHLPRGTDQNETHTFARIYFGPAGGVWPKSVLLGGLPTQFTSQTPSTVIKTTDPSEVHAWCCILAGM